MAASATAPDTTGTHTAAELKAAGATEIFPDPLAIHRRLMES